MVKLYLLVTVISLAYFCRSDGVDLSPLGTTKIGEVCGTNQDCVGYVLPTPRSQCSASKRCACLSTYISSAARDDCLPIRNQLNQECTENQQCEMGDPGTHSECRYLNPGDAFKRCVCKSGAVNSPGSHECYLRASSVGDACEIQEQCGDVAGSYCTSFNKTCACNQGYIPAPDSKSCLPIKLLGQPCVSPSECTYIPNAFCRQQVGGTGSLCSCNDGYIQPTGANRFTQCNKLARFLQEPCTEDNNQCENLSEAICDGSGMNKKCHCPVTHVANPGNTACLVNIPLNASCSATQPCTAANSACVGVKCTCKPGEFVESWITPGQCVPTVSEENSPCIEDRQCQHTMGSSSTCRDNTCKCVVGHKFYSNRCYYPVLLDNICQTREECVVGVSNYTVCSAQTPKRCECMADALKYDNSCFEIKRIGDPCVRDLDCRVPIGNLAQCDSALKMCSCKPGYIGQPGEEVCSSGTPGIKSIPYVILFVATLVHNL